MQLLVKERDNTYILILEFSKLWFYLLSDYPDHTVIRVYVTGNQ